QRADRRHVPHASSNSVSKRVESKSPSREYVSSIEEESTTDAPRNRKAIFGIRDEDRSSSDRRDRSLSPHERRLASRCDRFIAEISEEIEWIGAMRGLAAAREHLCERDA